ncbi:hypothetical protein [Pseudonocardia adelaidensis]|uniref:hypothetical protein n=1 Tax=Pseudonocardia adelaidensis TaxID=648754 RepID=UPI003CD09B37
MRVIVRRERPHPGAQTRLHRRRRVAVPGVCHRHPHRSVGPSGGPPSCARPGQDRIRCAENHGLDRLPSRQVAINAAWVELAMTAADLIASTPRPPCSTATHRRRTGNTALPLLHVAARITRGQRRLFVPIDKTWPWRDQLAAAFARLHLLPLPIT